MIAEINQLPSGYVEVPLTPIKEPTVNPANSWLNYTKVGAALQREEAGDADLFAELFRDKVCYDHSERQWYIFGNHYWEKDRTRQVIHLVINQVASQYLNAAAQFKSLGLEGSKETIKELQKRANSLGYLSRVEQVLKIAGTMEGIALTGDEWHKDTLLLACPNGVLDLNGGKAEFREGRPKDYLRNAIPTEWKGLEEPAPRWESFLQEIFAQDTEMVDFVRRLFGYGLSGLSTDDRFPILWGEGRNGKDTLLETIEYVLSNQLASPIQSEVLVTSERSASNATPQIIALRNRRIVWVNETNEGARINAGQVKMLTGGGTIAARPLYGQAVEFKPTHLIMLMTNHKPHTGDDDAIWKRLLLIEFGQKFVDEPTLPNEHPKDGNLSVKLQKEASGILAWIVRGTIEWMADGLKPPQVVKEATKEYRSDEDIIEHFIYDCVELGAGYEEQASLVYEKYRRWSEDSGYGKGMGKKSFFDRISKRFERKHTMKGNFYAGVRFRS